MIVPIKIILSCVPKNSTTISVTSAAAAAFAKLLQSKMTLSNLSVSLRSFMASFAPTLPYLLRCLSLNLFTDIKLVSEIAKNADSTKRTARRAS